MEEKKNPLFQVVKNAIIDGVLPGGFSLPRPADTEGKIRWASGARDGVQMYHMGIYQMSDEETKLMESAIRAASDGQFALADELFGKLMEKMSALVLIDPLQEYMIHYQNQLKLDKLFQYGLHALEDSTDAEGVKIGLSFIEMFDIQQNAELCEKIRTIGLCDEFTLFAIYVMQKWENWNDEIWELAKKVQGWGRVHAVERVEPVSDEIKEWFLTDAVHNRVLPSYSAFTCWEKADAWEVLKGNPTRVELTGIRDILDALLDEGPGKGITELENMVEVFETFLKCFEKTDLVIEDYEVIRRIRFKLQDDPETFPPELVAACERILSADECKEVIEHMVVTGLQSAPGKAQTRSIAYASNILKTWVELRQIPVSELPPELRDLLEIQ